ncbi:MAG TPA: hypothetical protein VLV86_13465 [Vicinamibacterales bacterium]|nr:hypothetical protein [Vicinamibacterales bacterium]
MSEVPALLPPIQPVGEHVAKTSQRQTDTPSLAALCTRTCVVAVIAALVVAYGLALMFIRAQQHALVPQRASTLPAQGSPPADFVRPRIAPSAPPEAPPHSGDIEWVSRRLTQLNVRPRWRASALHVEDAALLRDLSEGISELWVGKLSGNEDAIFVGGRVDGNDWRKLHASIKPTGVVWRIYPHRSTQIADASLATAAAAAGFVQGTRIRYSSDYIAEQFTPRRKAR